MLFQKLRSAASQPPGQIFLGKTGLVENVAQRAGSKRPVQRPNRSPITGGAACFQRAMTPNLPRPHETRAAQGPDHFPPGDGWQMPAQAAMKLDTVIAPLNPGLPIPFGLLDLQATTLRHVHPARLRVGNGVPELA